jgi:carbon-monoxide dehydrogenase large subunit
MKVVGRAYQPVDIVEKVTGKTVFGADLTFPDMLYARALRSPYPHARILNVDVRKARKVLGVVAVITGEDVAKYGLFGMAIEDRPILAIDKVRYIGDPIVAVSAIDENIAEEALELIKVDYEEIPAVYDPLEAKENNAVLIHEDLKDYAHKPLAFPVPGTNICSHFQFRNGNVEEGFKISEEIFEDTFKTQAQTHCCMEPRMSLAMTDQLGRIVVWSSTQSVYAILHELSKVFKIPENKIRVIAPPLGGGFGSKLYLKAEPIAVALSQRSGGKPVKFQWTRQEEFTVPSARHPTIIQLKTGVKRDGTLIAQEIKIFWDTGAYAETGPLVCQNGSFSAPGPYVTPNVKVDGYCIYTNKIVAGAMRGFGVIQPMFALESQMDVIAERLGIDPVEIRLRNAVDEGSVSASRQQITHTSLKECILKAARESKWEDRNDKMKGKDTIVKGKGLSIMHKGTITPTYTSAIAKINSDGTLNLCCSTANLGQGAQTVLCQIGAETSGISCDKVCIISSDTDISPYDRSTTSSRSTFHMGNAVRLAVQDAKKELLKTASHYLKWNLRELRIKNGAIYNRNEISRGLSIEQFMKQYLPGVGSIIGKGGFHTRGGKLDRDTGWVDIFSVFWMYACVVVDVNVDTVTGKVKVEKIVVANDVGKAINPETCRQQIEGGCLQGLGYSLMEELIFDKGKILNDSFTDYKIPTLTESPEVISLLIEKPHPEGPFGAKGMSEAAIAAVPPAVANAVFHATGVRIKALPITGEKVLRGLKNMRKSND